MSRNARKSSVSLTTFAGTRPTTIRQKRQLFSKADQMLVIPRSAVVAGDSDSLESVILVPTNESFPFSRTDPRPSRWSPTVYRSGSPLHEHNGYSPRSPAHQGMHYGPPRHTHRRHRSAHRRPRRGPR